jgi:hypothetical protein
MAKDTVPRPGMPQSQKDELGLAQMRAAERPTWAPDDALDDMTRDQLEAEAGKRRVVLTDADTKSKTSLVKAIRSVDPDAKGKTGAEARAVADADQGQGDKAPADQTDREPGPGQDQGAGAGREVAQAVPEDNQGKGE